MKLLINLLIICLIFIITSSAESKLLRNKHQYVNFQVYSDNACTQESNYGIGYSSLINNCISFDQQNYFIFSIKDKVIKWNIAKKCSGDGKVQSRSYTINSCVPSNVIDLDVHLDAIYKPFYYKLSTSSKPFIPSNAFVKSLMLNICNTDNQVIIEYLINGTIVNDNKNGDLVNHYCSSYSNKPTIQRCSLSNENCVEDSDLSNICKESNFEDENKSSGTGWPNLSSGLVHHSSKGDQSKSSGTGWPNFSSGLVNKVNVNEAKSSGTGWPNFSSGLVNKDINKGDESKSSGTGWPNFSSGLVNKANVNEAKSSGTGWPNFSSGLAHHDNPKQNSGKTQSKYYSIYCS